MKRSILAATALICAFATPTHAADPIPVGLDTYAQWDRWPQQRIGVRAYMRSTYDRDGGNRTADASHFLYAERPISTWRWISSGAGSCISSAPTTGMAARGITRWTASTMSCGKPAPPTRTIRPDSTFEPAAAFPPPLAWTWSTTKGADLNWVPIAFDRSLRLAYGRTFYGTGYYIYHQFAEGTPLSTPLVPFDLTKPPDPKVLDLISRAGTDIAPRDIARAENASPSPLARRQRCSNTPAPRRSAR